MTNHGTADMPVATPARTKALVRAYGVQPKKSLGQNFLIDPAVLRKIVQASEASDDGAVLEIGPGLGALTEQLARAAGKVVAIEIDQRMLPVLADTLSPYPNAEVVHGDVLKLDLRRLFEERFSGFSRIGVAANLPYYVTTPILMKLLEERLPLSSIVVMVQKEVADRLKAAPGTKDYGSLSVAVQYYGDPEIVATVPPSAFIPQPNVESAVIKLRVRERPAVEVADEPFFFRVVHAAFAQRRKTLANNLAAAFPAAGKERLGELLQAIGIEPSRRGETLSLPEFARLAAALAETGLR